MEVVSVATKLAMKGYSVLLLARTNVQVANIEELLLAKGVRYYRLKNTRMLWKDFIEPVLNVWEALKENKVPDPRDLAVMLDFSVLRREVAEKVLDVVRRGSMPLDLYSKIRGVFENKKEFMMFFNKEKLAKFLGGELKAMVALDTLWKIVTGGLTVPRGKVIVDTIHASKGREADVVILLDGITPRIYNALNTEFENEVRVWYVGMTRARKALYVVPYEMPFLASLLRGVGYG
jgi:DNA helicase-2/ATP-dependent DNA helicase PcrA